MAKFLNTTALNYELENIIKNSSKFLILISPYFKVADRIRTLIEEKSKTVPIIIVYGKDELKKSEQTWINNLSNVRLHFCKNLHAKCYMNQHTALIGSMNLYEFSQVNNHEMGVLLTTKEDEQAIKDTLDEAKQIIAASDIVQGDLESLESQDEDIQELVAAKLTASKKGKQYNLKKKEFLDAMTKHGYLELRGKNHYATEKGKTFGIEFKKGPYGYFFLFPDKEIVELI